MPYEEIELIDNQDAHNFELWVDGQKAFIDYKKRKDRVYLLHTEVPETMEGRGIAAALVEKTLKYIEENRCRLYPLCSYVQVYLKKHPEWKRLVKEDGENLD